jgi:hypothetical protein
MDTPNMDTWHYTSGGMSKRQKKVVEQALEKGFWPAGHYVGIREPWELVCMECNSVIETTYSKFIQKGFKCKVCHPLNFDAELQVMLQANLKPLEPYSGNSANIWKSQCLLCGQECFPRYYDVSKRKKGGCKPCSLIPSPETASESIEIMRKANLEPLTPFTTVSASWECRCMKCGETVSPSLHNVRRGHGGCVYCQVAAFKPSKPAYLYFIHHNELASFKIGIGNVGSVNDRLKSHINAGWTVISRHDFELGKTAITIEKAILKWIRNDLKIPIHLVNSQFKHGGASETFSDESVSQLTIQNKINEMILKHMK